MADNNRPQDWNYLFEEEESTQGVDFSQLPTKVREDIAQQDADFFGVTPDRGEVETEALVDSLDKLPGTAEDYGISLGQSALRGVTGLLDIGPMMWNASGWLLDKALPEGSFEPTYIDYPSKLVGELTGIGDTQSKSINLKSLDAARKQTLIDTGLADESILAGQDFTGSEEDKTDLTPEQQRKLQPYGFGLEILTSGGALGLMTKVGAVGSVARNAHLQAQNPALKTVDRLKFIDDGRVLPRSIADFQTVSKTVPSLVGDGKIAHTLASKKAFIKEQKYSGLSALSATIAGEATDGHVGTEIAASILVPSVAAIGQGIKNRGQNLKKTVELVQKQEGMALTSVDHILQHADDPASVIHKVQAALAKSDGGSLNMSLGALTGDKGILAFEKGRKGIGREIADLDETGQKMLAAGLDDIVEGGIPESAQAWLKSRIDSDAAHINNILNQAKVKAEHAVDSAGTSLRTEDASVVLDETIRIAESASKSQADALWAKVPSSEKVIDSKAILTRLKNFHKDAFKTKTAKKNFMKGFEEEFKTLKALSDGRKVDIQELIDLRSSITTKLRNLPFENRNKFNKHFASEFQGIILEAIESSPNVGSAYKRAVESTKKNHEIFDNTYFSTKGEDISQVLGGKVFRRGDQGGVAADEIIKAAGFNGGILDASADMVRASFARAVVDKKTGQIDVRAAERFLSDKEYGSFLRRPEFKQVRDELEAAVAAGQDLNLAKLAEKDSTALLNKSAAQNWINAANTNAAIDSIIGGSAVNPIDAVRELKRQAAMDESGKALKGLQQSFIERLRADGTVVPFRDRKKLAPLLDEMFDPEQVKQIKAVFGQVDQILARKGMRATMESYEKSLAMSTIGKVLGARIGAQFGQSPLIMANVGGRIMEKVVMKLPHDKIEDLTNKMLLNPELFAEYKGVVDNIKDVDEAVAILHQWMLIAGNQANLVVRNPVEDPNSILVQ